MMTTPSTIYPSCGGCVCACDGDIYIYLGSLFPYFILSLFHPRPPLIMLQCKQSRRRWQSCWEFLPSTSRNCFATQGCWYTVILSFLVLSSLLTRTFSVTLLNLDITCYPHFLPLFFLTPSSPYLDPLPKPIIALPDQFSNTRSHQVDPVWWQVSYQCKARSQGARDSCIRSE